MKLNPLVSVLIPVYNAEKFVSNAIRSILDQTYKNLEIFIIDDGSVDNSREIINSFKDFRIKKFYNTENKGYLKVCNEFFTRANGELIAFQDADDWSDLKRIEKIVTVLNENKSIVLCGCNFVRINDSTGDVMTKSQYPIEDERITQYIIDHKTLPFCGASVIFRKELLDQVGGYREYFDRIGYEHFDWFLLVSEKFKVANTPEALYYFRYNRDSFSRSDRLINFRKFYAPEIAWFLREQRAKHGNDALQSNSLRAAFDDYLSSLEQEYTRDRFTVYKRLIIPCFYNNDFKSAFKLYKSGIKEQNVKAPILTVFFLLQTIKALIKIIVK